MVVACVGCVASQERSRHKTQAKGVERQSDSDIKTKGQRRKQRQRQRARQATAATERQRQTKAEAEAETAEKTAAACVIVCVLLLCVDAFRCDCVQTECAVLRNAISIVRVLRLCCDRSFVRRIVCKRCSRNESERSFEFIRKSRAGLLGQAEQPSNGVVHLRAVEPIVHLHDLRLHMYSEHGQQHEG